MFNVTELTSEYIILKNLEEILHEYCAALYECTVDRKESENEHVGCARLAEQHCRDWNWRLLLATTD